MRHRSVTYHAARTTRDRAAEATFQALADPTRRAVLDLLRRGSQPAGQIAGAFPVSPPRHLQAPAPAAPRPPGPRTPRRTPPRLPVKPGTAPGRGLLARSVPQLLDGESHKPEGICGSRARAGIAIAAKTKTNSTSTRQLNERNEAMKKSNRIALATFVILAAT